METFSSKIREDDPNQYLNADTQEINYNYQPLCAFLATLWDSINRFLFDDYSKSDLPSHLQGKYIFNRPQLYRPVPIKQTPLEVLNQMKQTSKGFDPISMTLARCKNEHSKQLKAKSQIPKPQRVEINIEEELPPMRKIIKRYCFQDDKKEEQELKLKKQQIRETNIKSALDELVKDYEQKKIQLEDKSFRPFFNTQPPVQVKQDKQPQNQIKPKEQNKPLTVVEPKQSKQSLSDLLELKLDVPQEQDKVAQQRSNNPFMSAVATKPISLLDFIQKNNSNGTEFLPNNRNSPISSEASKSDASSTITFNPNSHHRLNQTSAYPNSPSQSLNSTKSGNQMAFNNDFSKNQGSLHSNHFNAPSNFNQFNEPIPKQLVAFSPPKPMQTQQNQFLKGIIPNISGTAKDFFKPTNTPANRLFEPTPSEKTHKKTGQSYRKRRADTSVRIQ